MGVDFLKENHVAYITLNRPKAMNSLDPESIERLKEIWKEVREDRDVRVAVLTGTGEKSNRTHARRCIRPTADKGEGGDWRMHTRDRADSAQRLARACER